MSPACSGLFLVVPSVTVALTRCQDSSVTAVASDQISPDLDGILFVVVHCLSSGIHCFHGSVSCWISEVMKCFFGILLCFSVISVATRGYSFLIKLLFSGIT